MSAIKRDVKYGYDDALLMEWLEHVDLFVKYGGRARQKTDKKSFLKKENNLWGRTKAKNKSDVEFGIQELVRTHKLNRVEARVLVTLLYLNLQHLWTDRRFIDASDYFAALSFDSGSGLRNYKLVGPDSKLSRAGLIEIRGRLTNPAITISDKAFRKMMRPSSEPVRREDAHETPDCPALFDTFEPRVGLSDVVLPPETQDAVEDALYFARNRDAVLGETGLHKVIEKGTGLSLLFYGPPGTGKTITAEAFAAELGKKISVVRPEAVESPYFGATEKNIARLFDLASSADAVVVFDECDSFFASRPAGEAYQNELVSRQVNMFLRGLEETEGVFILTSNREEVLDPALERRLSAKVYFGLPDEDRRLKLWRKLLPSKHKLSGADLNCLSSRFPVSGGIIKQAVLTAVRRATRAGRRVNVEDLLSALREYSGETRSIGF